jgi:cytochrome c5
MQRTVRRAAIIAAVAAGLCVLAAAGVYAVSEHRLSRTYDAEPPPLAIPNDSVSIARGRHLTNAVLTCAVCHGEDGGGKVYADMGPVGVVAGPNLTRGHGGIAAARSDRDLVRAIRYGVRRNGSSFIAMPSENFTYLNDTDLGAVIAYVRQLPPVDREVPVTRFGPVGRALLAAGKMKILVAPKTPRLTARSSASPGPTKEYGRYLADLSCHGCHGFGLSGGKVAGGGSLPPASNLTPAGIGAWAEADFVRAMREGKRPNGSSINEFMPWRGYRQMTEDELRALWVYLRSVPAREFGHK